MIRDAATVILWREATRELYWVRRSDGLRFAGGFHALPGGGWSSADRSLRHTAARELWEETGIALPAEALRPAGRWLTPDFSPIRYDTRFFLAPAPPGAEPRPDPSELSHGEWITPERALAAWRSGAALVHPPLLFVLKTLARHGADPAALDDPSAEGGPGPTFVTERIEHSGDVFVLHLETPTLPPARHTACYLVGKTELTAIDPGATDPAEQERLARFVRGLESEGRRLTRIVLTHHHPDHVGGARALSDSFGVPVLTRSELKDGERLGPLHVLHTPGHTQDHLCLYNETTRALFCGDMVSSLSTILIDPPPSGDGAMDAFLRSLERLIALGETALFPGHGEPIPAGRRKLEETLRHRQAREAKILAALEGTPRRLAEVTARAYDDIAPGLLPLAERSTLAHLRSLCRAGKARSDGDTFFLP